MTMTARTVANANFQIPYEIGNFIASQVKYVDNASGGLPWASHKNIFASGPFGYYGQMTQGILLEVNNYSDKPMSLRTRYGAWTVFASSMGSFKEVFEVVKTKLDLRKVEELSDNATSFWAVQTWNGKNLATPVVAKKEEFIPEKEVFAAYNEFKASL